MTLRMTPAELDKAEAGLLKGARDIKGHLDDLARDLDPLKSQWEGSAQEAYRVAQEEWNATMDDMIAILKVTANTVNEAKVAYQTRDAMQARGFGG